MRIFFFGVDDPKHKGHYLYDNSMRQAPYRHPLPFNLATLDGGLLDGNQDQARHQFAIVNGWTILGMYDRTGDSRGNSNASFVIEGVHTESEACRIAEETFPKLWNRIHQRTTP